MTRMEILQRSLESLTRVFYSDLRHMARGLYLDRVCSSVLIPNRIRFLFYRLGGLRVERCIVASGVTMSSKQTSLGRRCFVNKNCFFESTALISIGERVHLGPEVCIVTSNHDMNDPYQRAGAATNLPVSIGAGAWIGARAIILPGVVVGEGAVVGAGTVVSRDVVPHSVVLGTSGRWVRDIEKQTAS